MPHVFAIRRVNSRVYLASTNGDTPAQAQATTLGVRHQGAKQKSLRFDRIYQDVHTGQDGTPQSGTRNCQFHRRRLAVRHRMMAVARMSDTVLQNKRGRRWSLAMHLEPRRRIHETFLPPRPRISANATCRGVAASASPASCCAVV